MHFELKALIDKANETCRSALEQAAGFCLGLSHYEVDIEHVLCKLLERQDADMTLILSYYDVDVDKVRADLEKSIEQFKRGNARTPSLSPNLSLWLQEAWLFSSLLFQEDHIRSAALLHALLENPRLRATLPQGPILDLSRDRLRLESASLIGESCEARTGFASQNEAPKGSGSQNPANSKTPNLDLYTVDLTARARADEMDPIGGRDREIQSLIDILVRRRQNNPILLGEAGVGKTAIVEGLALRIAKGRVPPILTRVSLRVLDLGLLQAGAGVRGEFENRLKNLIKEIKHSDAPVILFVDEAHSLIGAGGAEGSGDAANLLKPALARGELRAIAATTRAEYKKYIEKDSALERRFQPVMVAEPDENAAMAILRGLRERYEIYHGITIRNSAITAAVQLSQRYISDRFLPDKAIDLIDEAASTIRTQIDSMPIEIDQAMRLRRQLEIELEALKMEDSEDNRERLTELTEDIKTLDRELESLQQRWRHEKSLIETLREKKEQLEALKVEASEAERRGDLSRAAEIRYGALIQLERNIADVEQTLQDFQQESGLLREEVTDNDVARVVSAWTGIPVNRMLESEVQKLLKLEERLHERVVGQDRAVSAVANAIRRSSSGLQDPDRPLGSFLFLGPTGVGKTELARALSDQLFDSEKKMIRLDMSEYMERHSVSRLIGSPPGYVGHEEGGQLTESVRRSPYAVILFDEIEKAHPEVFNVLLQILDDGRLTDGKGRLVNFRNTVIIMTSNLASDVVARTDLSQHEKEAQLMSALKGAFRPEFLNRIDDVIPFDSLGDDMLREIVKIQLDRVNKRLMDQHTSLDVSEEAMNFIARAGYDPAFGARPIKRAIQNHLLNTLASSILAGKVAKGGKIRVDLKNHQLEFSS